ncbi:MAG TPA: hypothetical protein VF141_03680 [Chryseolinea sp.]
MKSFTILTLFSMLSTGIQNNPSLTTSPEKIASNVIHAFRTRSIEEYNAMFPTLSEFHQIMDENDKLYGGFLNEAKREFTSRYEQELIPSMKEAFTSVIAEGTRRGIDWQKIEFARVHKVDLQGYENHAQLDIVFREKGKEYTLRIENAFIWRGEWKVTQFIQLIEN